MSARFHHSSMAVPMGDDPTTSRLTTECSAVELRNHKLGEQDRICTGALKGCSLPPYSLATCSMVRPAGFAPAPPRWQRGILLLRNPIAWWSCGESNPRSAACKAAILPLNDSPTFIVRIQFSKNWGEQPVSSRSLRLHKPMCRPLHHARHGATPQIRTEPVRFTKAVLVLTSMCGVPEERFELPTYSL